MGKKDEVKLDKTRSDSAVAGLSAVTADRPIGTLVQPKLSTGIPLVLAALVIVAGAGAIWILSLQAQLIVQEEENANQIRELEARFATQKFDSLEQLEDIGVSLKSLDDSIAQLWRVDEKQRAPDIKILQDEVKQLKEKFDVVVTGLEASEERLTSIERQLELSGGNTEEGIVGRVAQLVDNDSLQKEEVSAHANQIKEMQERLKAIDKYRETTNQHILRLQTQLVRVASQNRKRNEAAQVSGTDLTNDSEKTTTE